ncbi:reverse transcriptase family protein [Primorskyibacter aestuariivivens]|uniref:reverse transcriptase family protein n=1 Tax=Primorskyibacter aestuariivivens TaxID=1888912 RepID=UPI0023007BD7|nr:reverse transcriptase family protein [Primorskyibacter aestuariivivens]MDA7428116.1 reverse transcriptase family protein [Primorskyibacter aestuariivivens]
MTAEQFFHRLADPLSRQPWRPDALAARLRALLPTELAGLAHPIALQLCNRLKAPVGPPAARIAAALREIPECELPLKYALKHGVLPAPDCDSAEFLPAHAFATAALPPLTSSDDLAFWLGLTPDQLTRFADQLGLSNRTDNAFAPHYLFHTRPKRDGTLRLIEEPKPLLKRLQRRLLHGLLDAVPPSPHAYGFTPGRSCAEAASRHCGEALVVSFDLRSFFPSITAPRVFGLFRTLGYPADVARLLTGLCTLRTPSHIRQKLGRNADPRYANRHLPQGAPSSPALANLCAFGLDRRLAGLARRLDATYSRYADDLTFSGDADIGPPLLRAVPQIVREERFALAPAKTRLSRAYQQQRVTGIVVNRHLNLPRRDFDRLKAEIHQLPRDASTDTLHRLMGRIAWVETLNPAKAARLRAQLDKRLSRP